MHTVSLLDENKEFEVKDKAIIFDALEDQGEALPHGCLSGSCGACRIEIVEGSENLHKPSMIEENTIQAINDNHKRIHGNDSVDGRIIRLACRAKVHGDVKIKLAD